MSMKSHNLSGHIVDAPFKTITFWIKKMIKTKTNLTINLKYYELFWYKVNEDMNLFHNKWNKCSRRDQIKKNLIKITTKLKY
jgi:hypothetical protein